jgi:hypothetical protein
MLMLDTPCLVGLQGVIVRALLAIEREVQRVPGAESLAPVPKLTRALPAARLWQWVLLKGRLPRATRVHWMARQRQS